MTIEYIPKGVCSRKMTVEADKGVIQKVSIEGGCSGNLQGISRLVEGMPVEQAISRLSGIRCGWKNTSSPDQLSKALQQYKE